jgi:outer membrane protein TolC
MQSRARWVTLFVALLVAGGAHVEAQQSAPQRLTLRDAIGLALKQNLSVRVASTQVEELEGTRERRRASLLPHVNGTRSPTARISTWRHGNFLSRCTHRSSVRSITMIPRISQPIVD